MQFHNLSLPLGFSKEDIVRAVTKKCGKAPTDFRLTKLSVDARKSRVKYVCSLEAAFDHEKLSPVSRMRVPAVQSEKRPIVIGFGPCGLFAALTLAKSGLRPIVLERGAAVEERTKAVQSFWKGGELNPSSNVQFGEGGAGTFSDGKLTTQIHNPLCREVLATFADYGAPAEILYLAKPHIGTDRLSVVVKNIRSEILRLGGEIHFDTQVTDLLMHNGRAVGVAADRTYFSDYIVLAVGHSARDTFQMLHRKNMTMTQKAFSVGARIEHLQRQINQSQYGADASALGAADYKLSYHTLSGRGVYTFCMCPGGQVVAAASEPGGVVTNGMSLHARDGQNANAALLVSVLPEDYDRGDVLDGMRFQRELEQRAFEAGGKNYFAPCQRVGDFLSGQKSAHLGPLMPTYRPGVVPADLNRILPAFVCDAMREALPVFGQRLRGFDAPDALLTGVETRSSSPIRMVRDENFQSSIPGLYPAGEGAGFAGGIVSSAVDGIKIALQIIRENA